MTYRDLFMAIMDYGEFDRMPLIYWGEWNETRERWVAEGLPKDTDRYQHFCAVNFWGQVSPHTWNAMGEGDEAVHGGLFPPFEEIVIDQTEEYRTYQARDGVIMRSFQHQSSLPLTMQHRLKDAASWEEYKKRLLPDPRRLAPDLDQRLQHMEAQGIPIGVQVGSFIGWLRNWMGVEGMAYRMADQPDLIDDIILTIAQLSCWLIEQVGARVQIDVVSSWEDICGSAGPLISPRLFKRYIAPGYRAVREKMETHAAHLYAVDSDGDVTALAGHWLDAGVNLLLPMEVGTFGGDARVFRKKYGKDLRMIGNLDKRTLARGPAAVQAEIDRLTPLMREGGFIIIPDHCIPPDVPLPFYEWYAQQIRDLRL